LVGSATEVPIGKIREFFWKSKNRIVGVLVPDPGAPGQCGSGSETISCHDERQIA
jgi:hypothetical protein